jgi:TPR repeat protein
LVVISPSLLFIQKDDEIKITKRDIQNAEYSGLGARYRNWDHFKERPFKVFEWHYQAALEGYSNAQVQVGYSHQCGRYVSRDYKLAMEWYQKASESNNEKVKKSLERLNEQGNNVKEEHKSSIYLCLFHDDS